MGQVAQAAAARFDGRDFLEALGQFHGEQAHTGVEIDGPLASGISYRAIH